MTYQSEILRKRTAVAVVLIICFSVGYMHREEMIDEVEEAVKEHVLVVSEAMWNFETNSASGYFAAVAEKYNYRSVKLVEVDGEIFNEYFVEDSSKIERYLSYFRLVPLKTFQKDIFYRDENIGKIIVVWRDTSVYFSAYIFWVAALLIVIVNLYSRTVAGKRILEEKAVVNEQQLIELRQQKEFIENIFDVVPEGLITLSGTGECLMTNHSFATIVEGWARVVDKESDVVKAILLESIRHQLQESDQGQYSMSIEGYNFNIDYSSSKMASFVAAEQVVSLRDVTKITELERDLNQSRKLEAVGRLAAGIAHEINTPTQYVVANMDFLADSFEEIRQVLSDIGKFGEKNSGAAEQRLQPIVDSLEAADWDFLEEEIPKALSQSKDGLRRISAIVSAMKHFSHPSGASAEPRNINSAIENTVIVARNEWKYVAELTMNLDPGLPLVPCYLDELNQVLLGMIVNSSHAIIQKYGENSTSKGTIRISTQTSGQEVVIVISDDGMGMPKGVMEKVFDPFFTTKELNKGTGQGLAIAHDVIVNRHKGKISVDSTEGQGTTFTIVLPVAKL